MSKIKFNIVLLICLGMISATAQTSKKPAAKSTKPTTFTVSEKKTPAPSTDQGIFAEIETSKGEIVIQLAYSTVAEQL